MLLLATRKLRIKDLSSADITNSIDRYFKYGNGFKRIGSNGLIFGYIIGQFVATDFLALKCGRGKEKKFVY